LVTLKIYNVLGEEVATLVSERLGAGKYKYEWDGGGLASGVYLYRIETGTFTQTKKLIVLK
ncbi:MAG: T9SS type A sorting domain-containing protein, partial [Calditrichia bacterium]